MLAQARLARNHNDSSLSEEDDSTDDQHVVKVFQSDITTLDEYFGDEDEQGVYEEDDGDNHNPSRSITIRDCK